MKFVTALRWSYGLDVSSDRGLYLVLSVEHCSGIFFITHDVSLFLRTLATLSGPSSFLMSSTDMFFMTWTTTFLAIGCISGVACSLLFVEELNKLIDAVTLDRHPCNKAVLAFLFDDLDSGEPVTILLSYLAKDDWITRHVMPFVTANKHKTCEKCGSWSNKQQLMSTFIQWWNHLYRTQWLFCKLGPC